MAAQRGLFVLWNRIQMNVESTFLTPVNIYGAQRDLRSQVCQSSFGGWKRALSAYILGVEHERLASFCNKHFTIGFPLVAQTQSGQLNLTRGQLAECAVNRFHKVQIRGILVHIRQFYT